MSLLSAAVIGGSIGGLTAALLLRDGGFGVDVFERSHADLEGRGAGIVLHRESARYLTERLQIPLDAFSERAGSFRFLERNGQPYHEEPSCYRFTAWNSFYRPLREALGEDSYHLGSEVAGFEKMGDEVAVHLVDGGSERCSLLVCADGIASTARSMLAPGAGPRFAGYLGWRGVVRESELDEAIFQRLHHSITYYTPPRSHILSYPIPNPSESERLLNYVWYRNVADGGRESMTDNQGALRQLSVPPGSVDPRQVEALRTAAGEVLPDDLAAMVMATAQPFIQAVVDVEVDRMSYGRICLLGDAAFSARPHAAAGTAKAAADGWALADSLRGADDVPKALAAWEPAQLQRGRSLVARARRLGEMAQIHGTFRGGDPEIVFGLDQAGDSCFDT